MSMSLIKNYANVKLYIIYSDGAEYVSRCDIGLRRVYILCVSGKIFSLIIERNVCQIFLLRNTRMMSTHIVRIGAGT